MWNRPIGPRACSAEEEEEEEEEEERKKKTKNKTRNNNNNKKNKKNKKNKNKNKNKNNKNKNNKKKKLKVRQASPPTFNQSQQQCTDRVAGNWPVFMFDMYRAGPVPQAVRLNSLVQKVDHATKSASTSACVVPQFIPYFGKKK